MTPNLAILKLRISLIILFMYINKSHNYDFRLMEDPINFVLVSKSKEVRFLNLLFKLNIVLQYGLIHFNVTVLCEPKYIRL